MFYFSHLLRDEEMKEVIQETGMGVESIESVSYTHLTLPTKA